ncbi:MAG: heme o synthase [Candidatus Puniceispirillales bacterium]
MAQTLATSPQLAEPRDFIALMKPRVMSLVIFTGLVGMMLVPTATHPLLLVISLVAIAAGAGASGAINQWYDRDIDALMKRTADRPIPAGKVLPEEALSLGIIVSVLSVLVLWFAGGTNAALLLGFTIFFYGVVYTIWLKRSTAQNIVIGGAAGAFPPAIGWLAAGGGVTLEPILLFALIFIWTPPHFWALALVRNEDYTRAGVPMMPVVAGRQSTRLQILLYALVLAPLGVAPAVFGMASLFYGGVAAVLGLIFVQRSWKLWRSDSDADAMGLFKFSILYLFLIFLVLGIDATVNRFAGGL